MNERIKQLALQAGMVKILEEHAHEYGNGTFENTQYPELEKFAELIVQACAKRSEKLGQPELGKGSMKHFGVEE